MTNLTQIRIPCTIKWFKDTAQWLEYMGRDSNAISVINEAIYWGKFSDSDIYEWNPLAREIYSLPTHKSGDYCIIYANIL